MKHFIRSIIEIEIITKFYMSQRFDLKTVFNKNTKRFVFQMMLCTKKYVLITGYLTFLTFLSVDVCIEDITRWREDMNIIFEW